MIWQQMIRRWKLVSTVSLTVLTATLFAATYFSMKTMPDDLLTPFTAITKNTYLDRYGRRMNITYENDWNIHDVIRLHNIPEFLQNAFIQSEDKRFFSHQGIDWLARLNAIRQNLNAGEVVRARDTVDGLGLGWPQWPKACRACPYLEP